MAVAIALALMLLLLMLKLLMKKQRQLMMKDLVITRSRSSTLLPLLSGEIKLEQERMPSSLRGYRGTSMFAAELLNSY